MINDNKLLQTYNEIWDKVKNFISRGFDSESVCNDKYLKTKITHYKRKAYKFS